MSYRNKSIALGDQVTPLRREQARPAQAKENIPPRRRMQRGQDGLQHGSGHCLSLSAIQEKYHSPTSSQTHSEFSQKVHSDLGEASLYLCNPEGIQATSPDIYRGISNIETARFLFLIYCYAL